MQHIIFAYQYLITWYNSLKQSQEDIIEEIDDTIFDKMYDYK